MEIGGHTDFEGSEAGNQRLSQARAEAVLAALRARDLPLPQATARGYGESRPGGRQRHRRGPGAEPADRLQPAPWPRASGERRWIAMS